MVREIYFLKLKTTLITSKTDFCIIFSVIKKKFFAKFSKWTKKNVQNEIVLKSFFFATEKIILLKNIESFIKYFEFLFNYFQ